MAFAVVDGSTMVPQLRRSIDASRAAAMWLFSTEADEGSAESGMVPLADRAIAGLVRLLEKDLRVQVRFIADRANAAHGAAGGGSRRAAEDKPIGAGIGAPVRLADGRIHGMLCFFRHEPDGQLDERDVRRLEMSARLAARLIDGADAHGIAS
ncbi:GAF domain-containing protein [Variovorax sp. LARHSF232]